MKKLLVAALLTGFAWTVTTTMTTTAKAAEGVELPSQDWSFSGIFGTFHQDELQRGLQVFNEVCSSCHSLRFIPFRNLDALGYSEDEIKGFAATFQIEDGPNDEGDMFLRPGRPSDYWPAPFANPQAAAFSNGGAIPPDLSLMAEARKGGPDYIYALLTGYEDLPDPWRGVDGFEYLEAFDTFDDVTGERNSEFEMQEGLHFNRYFPGHQIAMALPLSDGQVEYQDGTEATTQQMAHDVSVFLMWAAEPQLIERKEMGVKVILFLLVFTGVAFAAKRRIWAKVH